MKCLMCNSEFKPRKKTQRYCSQSCGAKSRTDHLRKIHEAKRKYPKIEGLNRCQIFRRFNPEKNREELHKDNLKRGILIQGLGGKCVKCSYDTDIRALTLDHIHGDGKEDRKKRGSKIARYYVNHLEEAAEILQVLCANCHAIKTHENHESTVLKYRKKGLKK